MKRTFRPDHKKLIFFDMNDTLVHSERTFDSGFRELIREFTGRWERSSEDAVSPDAVLDKYKKEWARRSRAKRRNASRESQRQDSLRAALGGLPIAMSDRAIKQFFRDMQTHRAAHSVLYPDTASVLADLDAHYKLAVISNGSKDTAEAILARHRLDTFIPGSRIFASKQAGASKPSPLLFQHALQACRIKPSQAVMVGNSWTHDIAGATRVGMDAVWIQANHPKKITQRKVGKEKIVIIRSIGQLRAIFIGE